jgi:hypothetical protein
VAHLFAGIGIEAARLATDELREVARRWADPDRGAVGPFAVAVDALATGPVALAGHAPVDR